MVPSAIRVAVLVDPAFPDPALLRDVMTDAPTMGLQIQVLNVTTSREINAAFATFRTSGQTLYFRTGPFSPTGMSSWSVLRRGTGSPRYSDGTNILKSAD